MIARNFIKFPEALRFQREMFSNGYHNSPRIMRLVECIFDWTATVPDWWKEAKGRARTLAKKVKKSISDFFKEVTVSKNDELAERRATWDAWMASKVGKVDMVRTPTLEVTRDKQGGDELDSPVYLSYCGQYHRVAYKFGADAPYWGGVSI